MVEEVTRVNTMDPAKFRVPASDTKGHTVRGFFRLQPGIAHQLGIILARKSFPYRTMGDIYRHAIHRHLAFLDSISPLPSVTQEVDTIIELMRDEEFNNDFQMVFEKVSERINSHMGSGSIGEARRLLLVVQKHIEDMPEGYWRDRYKKELKTRFGYILEEAPKASLRYMSDEE